MKVAEQERQEKILALTKELNGPFESHKVVFEPLHCDEVMTNCVAAIGNNMDNANGVLTAILSKDRLEEFGVWQETTRTGLRTDEEDGSGDASADGGAGRLLRLQKIVLSLIYIAFAVFNLVLLIISKKNGSVVQTILGLLATGLMFIPMIQKRNVSLDAFVSYYMSHTAFQVAATPLSIVVWRKPEFLEGWVNFILCLIVMYLFVFVGVGVGIYWLDYLFANSAKRIAKTQQLSV